MHLLFWVVLVFILLPVSTYQKDTESDQNRVSGLLTINSKSSELKYGYVIDYGGTLRVMITDKLMTHDEVDSALNDVVKTKRLRGFLLSVSKDTKKLDYSYMYHEAIPGYGILMYSKFIDQVSPLSFESFDTTAVAGRLFSPKAAKGTDVTYSYDVKFKLKVNPQFNPKAVRVIGKGIETAPGKVFADFHKAIMTGSDEEFRQYLSDANKNADIPKEVQHLLKEMIPVELTIKKVDVQADTAELTVEGSRGGKVVSATIRMKLEKGIWKIVESLWQ